MVQTDSVQSDRAHGIQRKPMENQRKQMGKWTWRIQSSRDEISLLFLIRKCREKGGRRIQCSREEISLLFLIRKCKEVCLSRSPRKTHLLKGSFLLRSSLPFIIKSNREVASRELWVLPFPFLLHFLIEDKGTV